MNRTYLFGLLMLGACTSSQDALSTEDFASTGTLQNNHSIPNYLGASTTYSVAGSIDLTSQFFADLGTNGRTCGSCHKPADGWTFSASDAQTIFDRTDGLDPLFHNNDGTNSPDADTSTVDARRAAYSMLLSRGTIRVGIGMPGTSDYRLVAVDDPYNHASASELSLFRRPLPAANLPFLSTVMWDGRITGTSLDDALATQANGATQGHAQAPDPISQDERDAIVAFETGLFDAQIVAKDAGRLDTDGATGGAEALASQTVVVGRFNLFDAWQNADEDSRRAVYRGQELFNTRKRTTGAAGCNGCHTAQNAGDDVNGRFFNIGVASAANRTADLPLYTFMNSTTAQTVSVSDPGRALITGLYKDIGKFKVPSLRGLGARAPYFHNGLAKTPLDVVKFYEKNLNFQFNAQEEQDLVAFLSAL